MITAKKVTRRLTDYKEVMDTYKNEFPAAERMPIFFMNIFAKRKGVDFLAFFDDDKFIGFAYLITHKTLTHLFFFAVKHGEHSKGYGSKILTLIRERYIGNRIVLLVEEINPASENFEQRLRRRNFYIKNGFTPAGFREVPKYDKFDAYVSGGGCTKEEFAALIADFVGKPLNLFLKMKLTDN
jgi:ribosomal protein S18 acetylase RimI-like enzyme